MHDLRFAFRLFRRNPGYVAIVAGTLGLALGAITALTSVADATMFAPLPMRDGDRVVSLFDRQPQFDGPASASWPELQDWRKHATQLAGVAGERISGLSFRAGGGEPERVQGVMVSEDYFRVFAIAPTIGRLFSAEEHRKGGPKVAMLTQGFHARAFGADPGIIGRPVRLGGESYTVVGVVPAGGADLARGARDVYLPIEPRLPSEDRGEHYLAVFGRLAPGATVESARAELETLGPILDVEGVGHRIGIASLRDALYGKAWPGLLLLFGAAVFVLVIAASNVTSVMLARMHGRAQELGVRAALGANRVRLARQLLTESMVLALAGGLLGVLLAMWGKDLLLAMWPQGAVKPLAVPLAWRTLAVTSGIAMLVGALIGAAPALRGSRADLASALRGGVVPRTQRLRSALVVVQHAVAIMLLVGAGLLGKSLLRLLSVQPGYEPTGVVAMTVALAETRYPDNAKRRAFFDAVVERLRALPGVESASAISDLPLGRSSTSGSFEIAGRPEFPANAKPHTAKMLIDGDYFRAMHIPILQGRSFTAADQQLLIIVNKTFADRYFPGESPLGHRISTWGDPAEVVGVVSDVRRRTLDEAPEPQVYLNFAQTVPWVSFVVRTGGDPTQLFAAMKAQVFAVDPEQPVSTVGTMSDMVASSAGGRRLLALMVAAFAGVALLLAALGIYGVLSYSVSQRTREIGVRMALGARAGTVLRLILVQGLRLALIGVAVGLAGAFVLARSLGSFLYEVSPADPTIYAAVSGALVLVGVIACGIPARRAAHVDPMTALRSE